MLFFQKPLLVFALFFCLLTNHPLQGQPVSPIPLSLPKIEFIGVKDGLPMRMVEQLVQDRQGFIWIATSTGVFRYDGYEFLPLRKLAKNGKILPALPTMIYLQPDGALLLMVGKSRFFLYDPVQNIATVHPVHSEGSKEFSIHSGAMVMESGGSFLFEMEEEKKRFLLRYDHKKGLQKLDSTAFRIEEIHTLCKDKAGNIFWGTPEAGIRRYAPDGQLVDSLQIPDIGRAGSAPAFAFFTFMNTKDQLIVSVFNKKEMFVWDWQTDKILSTGYQIYYLDGFNGKSGNTWLMDANRIFQLDGQGRLHDLKPLLKANADFSIFSDVMEDAQGQVWVGTDNGILRFSSNKKPFDQYLNNPQPTWGKTTRGFCEDENGTVYFRCENCGNEAANAIYRINETTGQAEPAPFSYLPNGPSHLFGWTKAILQKPGENIAWTVGSLGLVRMDLDSRSVSLHPAVNASLVNNSSGSIGAGMTRKGEILAGGFLRQLFAFDPKTEKLQFLLPNLSADEGNYRIKTIMEASDGTIWVGTARGLVQVDAVQRKILRKFDPENCAAIITADILTILEDDDGSIWVGIFGGGLVHIFPKTGEAIQFSTADGLCNNDVTAILPYQKDYLWVSTYNGLSCFHKKDKSFVNYYEEDGLTHNEFNISSAFTDSKGRYYFGGMNGVNAFYPSEILKPQTPLLPLLLTGFTFYDEKRDTLVEQMGGLQALAEVTLSSHISWFQFNYALPEFANPRLNQFKTWLENFDKDWVYQGNSPFIRYNRLPAGDYILHIRAADSKGYWSDDELAIRITVQQVFYKTWWFILLCCLAIGAGGFALLRYRYQQRLALEQMRTRIASDLHDEVGSSLSHLNFLVGAFDMENSPETTAKAIEKSKELMRKTASNIRDVVWAIDARRDKTGDLLDRMEDFAFDMFSVKNIACRFQTDGVNREAVLNPFVRQNIFLVFKEAVNNIAKHSNATEVSISLSQTGNSLELTVADNGTCASPDKPSTGLGLENMQMRAKRIGGTVAIENTGAGWTVRLRVA